MNKVFSVKEASNLLQMNHQTFRQHIKKGHIKPMDGLKTKRIFFTIDALKEFVRDYFPNRQYIFDVFV